MGLIVYNTHRPYRDFEERVFRHRDDLTRLIRTLNADGKKYSATGHLQKVMSYCNFAVLLLMTFLQ